LREVDDQAAGVAWCVAEGLAEAGRVGVIGWSYGGYMALKVIESNRSESKRSEAKLL
jgi:dipeptidyl aminopeptidase/acylaminoacyl peptidase